MYIPLDQSTAHKVSLEEFLTEVESKFDYAIKAYKRTVKGAAFHPDMSTAKFTFTVVNGRISETTLEDSK